MDSAWASPGARLNFGPQQMNQAVVFLCQAEPCAGQAVISVVNAQRSKINM